MTQVLALVALLSAFPAAAAPSCEEMETQFSQIYRHVKTGCNEHADCRTGNYNWDPCAVQAVNKEQVIQDFEKTRSELHRLCGYIMKPCAALTGETFCVKGRCALYSEVARKNPAFRFRVPAVKEGEFKLVADTGIRCEAAPCPAYKTIFSGRVKNHRFTVPAALLLGGGSEPPDPADGGARFGINRDLWFEFGAKRAGGAVPAWIKKLPEEIELSPR